MPTVEGPVAGFEKLPNNGPWVATLELEGGRSLRLKTFEEEIARDVGAVRASGRAAVFQYYDRESKKINPHTNAPYVDHLVTGVTTAPADNVGNGAGGIDIPGLDAPSAPSPSAPSGEASSWEPHDLRAWRIALGVGAHLAVDTLPLLREDERRDFGRQTELAYAWALWVFLKGRELPGTQPLSMDTTSSIYPDDDIPF